MNKGQIIISAVGGMIAFVTMANVAAVNRGPQVDYTQATEEDKKAHLDMIAKGFSVGFRRSAGGRAEITDVYTDETADLVSIAVRFKPKHIDEVTISQFEPMRRDVERETCKLAEKDKMLERGITLRVRMFKPSGGKLGVITANEEKCRPLL